MTVDTSRLVFAHGPEALLKERRFMYTNTPPPEGEEISFETFSPRMLPSYGNHLSRDPAQPTAYRDVHTLGSSRPTEKKSPYREGGKRSMNVYQNYPSRYTSPSMKETSFGGKRVTFKNDLTTQNAKSPELSKLPPSQMSPMRQDVSAGYGKDDGDEVEELSPENGSAGFFPNLHRSHDDDDNTTTSGSYTLNVEDDIDDLPPPVSYSVA